MLLRPGKRWQRWWRYKAASVHPDKEPFPLEPDWSELWLPIPKRKPRELIGDEEERLVIFRCVLTCGR
jgi:hypothetical protein